MAVCAAGQTTYAVGSTLVSQVASWVNSNLNGAYFIITGEEGTRYTFKAFFSNMDLTYTDFPAVTGVTAATPKNNAKAPVMPILQATATDPNNTGLAYKYEASTDPGFTWVNFSSPWVGSGPYQVPQNKLSPATKYYYRVSVKDGLDGVYYGTSTQRWMSNAAWSFTTNTPAPTPTQSAVWAATDISDSGPS